MAADHDLTVVQMNDSHAYFDLHPELFWAGSHAGYRMAGGYARVGSLLEDIRKNTQGRVLAFDCGDTIHGTYPAVHTKGESLVPILNALEFDAMTAHWEFAYGPAQFKKIAAQLKYPVLAINCYDKATRRLIFEPYKVLERGSLRVGVIGIACNIVDKSMPASFSEGIYFTLGNEELPGFIEELRATEHVDVVTVVSHLGFPQDMKLLTEVAGIDVLLSGHTHNRLYQPVIQNGTIVIQSGCHGSFLGRLDLRIEGGKVADFRHELITVSESIVPDPGVQSLIDEAISPYREELAKVVGHTETPLNRNTILEATMDNLLLKSMIHLTGAQLAFSNGWRYGAPIPPGPVTLGDLYNIIPMNPQVSVVELAGDEVRSMIEENLEHTFSRDPYDQMGGYVKRCMGLSAYVKLENPKGTRVQELFVQGTHVQPERVYTATFVTNQAVPSDCGSNRQDTGTRAVDALLAYLATQKAVRADMECSIVAV